MIDKLQFFLDCNVREFVGKMLMIDRLKINQQKFSNSLAILGYYYTLIIFLILACEMLIENS